MHALLLGLSLGLGAGVAPGPLLAVVIRSTLEGGFGAGARVACGPLVTDLPIIVVAAALAASLPDAALAALGLGGGLFVLWLGIDALREAPAPVEAAVGGGVGGTGSGSLWRGAAVNVLNPHPWIFWLTVGVPVLGDAGVGPAARLGRPAAGRRRAAGGRGDHAPVSAAERSHKPSASTSSRAAALGSQTCSSTT